MKGCQFGVSVAVWSRPLDLVSNYTPKMPFSFEVAQGRQDNVNFQCRCLISLHPSNLLVSYFLLKLILDNTGWKASWIGGLSHLIFLFWSCHLLCFFAFPMKKWIVAHLQINKISLQYNYLNYQRGAFLFCVFVGHTQWRSGVTPGSALKINSWQAVGDDMGFQFKSGIKLHTRQVPHLPLY